MLEWTAIYIHKNKWYSWSASPWMLNFILNFLFFLFFYLLFSMDHIVGNAFVLSGNGNTSVCISQNLCRTDLKSGSMWVRLSLNCLHVWMLVVNVSPLIKLSRLEPSPQDSDFSTVWTRGDAGPQCHEHYRCSQVSLFYTTTKSLTFFYFLCLLKHVQYTDFASSSSVNVPCSPMRKKVWNQKEELLYFSRSAAPLILAIISRNTVFSIDVHICFHTAICLSWVVS